MLNTLTLKQRHGLWRKKLLLLCSPVFIFGLLISVVILLASSGKAGAATSDTLNFQGRLLTNTGGLVPDGSYNIEFNLYTVDTGGSTLWTENRTGGNAVTVTNGYYSVYLGDVTSFPTTIPWDQELWLGMNVNSDGEMTPRFKLTAVPYAFRAGELLDSSGNAYTGDDFAQLAPSTIQPVNAAVAALRLSQAGAGDLIQLQDGSSNDVFVVANNGDTSIAGGVTLGTATTTGQLAFEDGGGNSLTLQPGSQSGDLTFTLPTNYGVADQCLKTDGAGVLTFGDCPGGAVTVVKTVDESVTNSNTLQNDDELTFDVEANETWTVEFNVQSTSNTTADYRFAVAAPAGSTCSAAVENIENAQSIAQAGCGASFGNVTAQTATDAFRVIATINVGANAGPVTLQWAQNTPNAGATTVHAGSYLTARIEGTGGGGGGGGGSSSAFVQNGNAFGSTAILGTTDTQGLNIITDNTTRLSFTAAGAATINDGLTVDNGLTVNTGSLSVDSGVIDTSGALAISSGGSGNLSLDSASDVLVLSDPTLQRTAAGTTTIDLLDASGGTTLSLLNSDLSQVAGLTVEGDVTANAFSGDGSALTSLNGTNITSGTIADARLSTNVALLDTDQTFTARPNFSGALQVGNTANTTAGNIRWTGTDFEGYDGTQWVSLTGGGASTLEGVVAFGKVDGSTGTALNIDGASVVRNGTGDYTVTLDTAAPNANYTVLLAAEEPSATLDDTKVTVDNQTTAGFDVDVREGDNGTAADVRIDRDWHFMVLDPDAVAGGGGGGGGSSFVQGGNAFGATALLGTTDAQGLNIVTNGANALTFTSAGAATFTNGLTISSGDLDLGGGDITNTGAFTISSGGAGDLTLDSASDTLVLSDDTIQRAAAGTTTIDLLDASGGTTLSLLNSDGGQVAGLTVEGDVTANAFSGDGSSITSINGTNITSGTIADARLSTNVALLNASQTFTGQPTFGDGLVVGNTASASAGAIRWNGTDFEGYDGTQWVSLSDSGADVVTVIKTADEIVNNSATLQDDDLLTFAVGANQVWTFDFVVQGNSGTTPDFRFAVTAPAGSTCQVGYENTENAQTVGQYGCGVTTNRVAANGAVDLYRITGTITTGVTAGNVTLQWAQFTANASDTTIYAGSYVQAVEENGGSGGGGGGGGTSFDQGGNGFGATGILGTTDNFGLNIVTNGTNALTLDSSGAATFTNGLTISSGNLSVDSGVIDASSGLTISSGGAGDLTLDSASNTLILSDATIQRSAAGTTTIDLFDGSGGTTLSLTNSSGAQVAGLSVEGDISAATFTGDGSGLTDLDGAAITTGTIPNARLSATVALTDTAQTFTAVPTFSAGLIAGNSTSTTAGAIRWSGTDFEGFDGTTWVSLTADPNPLLQGVLAFGKVAGNGTELDVDGASIVRNGTGDYSVTLDTAAASADYTVQLSVEEDGTTRDDINISLDNQTTAGFDVTIREGDNSTTADVVRDRDWHFIVFDSNAAAGGGSGGGTAFADGGNAFGGNAVLGTTDTFGLSIITDGSASIVIDTAGEATFSNDTHFTGDVYIGTPPSPDALAQAVIYSNAAANKGLVVQGVTSQTANLFEIQNNTGTVLSGFNASGDLVLGQSTISSGATAARAVSLPDEAGTICLSGADSCGFLELASGTTYVDATSNDVLSIDKTTATGDLLDLQRSGSPVFTVANTGALQIQASSSTALDIRNTSGTSFFTVDSSSGEVRVGPATADANGVLFILDTKNTAGDPTGTDGAQYYNSNLGKFRCFEDGEWVDCIADTTPQTRSFVDTTSNAVVDNNTTDYWDTAAENNNSYPTLTPSFTTREILGTVSVEFTSATTGNRDIIARVERGIGAAPTCGSGTVVGGNIGIFSTNTGLAKTGTISFLDSPATTSEVFYTVCSDSGTNNAGGMTVTHIQATLIEVENSN